MKMSKVRFGSAKGYPILVLVVIVLIVMHSDAKPEEFELVFEDQIDFISAEILKGSQSKDKDGKKKKKEKKEKKDRKKSRKGDSAPSHAKEDVSGTDEESIELAPFHFASPPPK